MFRYFSHYPDFRARSPRGVNSLQSKAIQNRLLAAEVGLTPPHATTWGAVLGVGLLSTALAYVLYFRILAAAGATNLLLVTFLIPVSAILLGVLVLGEQLLFRHAGGMALIGLGLMFIDGRLPRRLGARATAQILNS